MSRPRQVMGAIVVAIALLGAACGSDDRIEATESPLAEFLGEDLFGGDFATEEGQARFAEEQRQREEEIATCMREQGFEYIPRDTTAFDFVEAEEGIAYDSREYAEKYGFGITTEWFSQQDVGPDLVGYDDSRFEEQVNTDPNQAIVEAMDDSTREAYYDALHGDESSFPTFDPETMTDEEIEAALEDFDFGPQGCEGEAWADSGNNDFYREFDDELQELYESVEDDPRIKEKQEEISNCVAEQGYEFGLGGDQFQDLFEQFQEGLDEIETMRGGNPMMDLSEEDFAAMSEEELDELFNQPQELPDEAKTKLAELQAEETAMAVAVWDCGGAFGGSELTLLYQEVSAEYERQFLDDNADRLAEYEADS